MLYDIIYNDISSTLNLNILEIGVNNNKNYLKLLNKGHKITLLDLIQINNLKTKKIHYIKSDFLKYNFNKTKYDIIYSVNLFNDIYFKNNGIKFIKKCKSLLKDKGIFYHIISINKKKETEILNKIKKKLSNLEYNKFINNYWQNLSNNYKNKILCENLLPIRAIDLINIGVEIYFKENKYILLKYKAE
ncbi:MAG: hypothetical protein PHR26_00860 [Candidatus ainarchaeum sp.]|nr:hypothetical protein [Candidatus ainarchaeum sp.]MDD3976125.1 hypothetical protein [Candidatus ainarchaeum sp.]